MKLKQNNIIIGIVLGLCLAFIIGADGPGQSGYQISSSVGYVWVLDTDTGQVWSNLRTAEGDVSSSSTIWAAYKVPKWIDYGIPGEKQER